MLIGEDDISSDVITLARYFSTFAYIRARLRFALIGGNLTAQSKGSHRGIGGGIQIPETELQALLPFPACRQSAPESLLAGYVSHGYVVVQFCFNFILVMYDNEFETMENKIYSKDKIEPQHVQLSKVLTTGVKS